MFALVATAATTTTTAAATMAAMSISLAPHDEYFIDLQVWRSGQTGGRCQRGPRIQCNRSSRHYVLTSHSTYKRFSVREAGGGCTSVLSGHVHMPPKSNPN